MREMPRRGADNPSFPVSHLVSGCWLGAGAHFLAGGGRGSLFRCAWTVTRGSERIGQLRRLRWRSIPRHLHSWLGGGSVPATLEARVDLWNLRLYERITD